MKKKIIIAAAVLVLASFAGWLISRYYLSAKQEKPLVEGNREGSQGFPVDSSQEIKVNAIFFYPDNNGLVKEEKIVVGSSLHVKMAESVLQEYFRGFKNDLKKTSVRGVYEDRNKILYVDLSDDFRRYFTGDAKYEYYLLKSVYQTLVTNIPEIRDVKIVVEGREIETIGGHMNTLTPLRDSVWY